MKKDILNETFNKHRFLLKKKLHEQGVIQQQPIQEENLDEDLKSVVTAGLLGLSSLFSKDKATNNVPSQDTQITTVASNTRSIPTISQDDLRKFAKSTYAAGIEIANNWLELIKNKEIPTPSLVNGIRAIETTEKNIESQIKYLQDWAKGKAGPIKEISLRDLIDDSMFIDNQDGSASNEYDQGGVWNSKYEDSQLGSELDNTTNEIITKIIKSKYPNFTPQNGNEDTDKAAIAVRNLKNLMIYNQYIISAERIISRN